MSARTRVLHDLMVKLREQDDAAEKHGFDALTLTETLDGLLGTAERVLASAKEHGQPLPIQVEVLAMECFRYLELRDAAMEAAA